MVAMTAERSETTAPAEDWSPLVDRFGRRHTSLRLSVTDRCNLRCLYCMPEQNVVFAPREELLTFEEIERLARVAIRLGVDKLRVTGGEPLVRRDVVSLVERLANLPGVRNLGLTTNGLLLPKLAGPLFAAGLRRLNISLDAFSEAGFERIARRKGFAEALAGIEAAQAVGFPSIKLNAVAIRGLTEPELAAFGDFARRTGIPVRFIEYMPLDAENAWERERVLFGREILAALAEQFGPLEPIGREEPSTPATDYRFADGRGVVGIIPSVSEPFCGDCNRFRITAEGQLRSCLFSQEETDLRRLLRGDREIAPADDAAIAAAMRRAIAGKWAGHQINHVDFRQPDRPMYAIGG